MGRYLDLIEKAEQQLPPQPSAPEPPEVRVARLDHQRNDRDRARRRGFDYDCGSPGHREYLGDTGTDCACLKRNSDDGQRHLIE